MDTPVEVQQKSLKQKFYSFCYNTYDKQYKKLLIIPMLLLLLAIIQIGVQMGTTGDFVHKGVSLKGGSIITILKQADQTELQTHLQGKFPGEDITVRSITESGAVVGVSIESGAQSPEQIAAITTAIKDRIPLKEHEFTTEVTGSAIGNSFFRQTFIAMIAAFILMGIVVFIYFRTAVPSSAVIIAAFSDIVITVAAFNLTGISLDTAGVAAFLMLIGYSVDTDILLTSRVLKHHEGTVLDRVIGAIKTGMTMTLTTLVAVVAALILTNNAAVKQIMVILLIGLIADIINTWIQNAAILRYYMERKHVTQTNS